MGRTVAVGAGLQADLTVTSNAALVGLALVAAAMGAMLVPRACEEWTEAVIGLWLMTLPWLLGLSTPSQSMLAAVGTGMVVMLLALWTLQFAGDYRNCLSDEPAAHLSNPRSQKSALEAKRLQAPAFILLTKAVVEKPSTNGIASARPP